MNRESTIETIKNIKLFMQLEDAKSDTKFANEHYEALDAAINSLEAWKKIKDELKYELCKEVHKKDGNIPCPNQTTSCLYVGLHIYELNEIINRVIDRYLAEVNNGNS